MKIRSFRQYFLISFLFLIHHLSFSQTDSCSLRISLLTCTPGEELYSTFGHSALRVIDSSTNQDIVFNYGTFNFDEPGFYTKFVRGKLLYYLSTEDFQSFKEQYLYERRSMIEQVLNLACTEKQKFFELLQQNLMGDNKYYRYDFLFDNCTTRLRDLLEKATDTTVAFSNVVNKPTAFRQHIFEYMEYNDKLWIKFGMDILLGNVTDRVMTTREAIFLPDYLLKGFDNGKIGSRPIVQHKINIIDLPADKPEKNFLTNPIFIFWLLLILIVAVSFSKNNSIKTFLHGFDGILFFIIGFAGLLMLVMWLGTEHVVCRNNYNLLWAWPSHLFMAFMIHSKKVWPKKYFLVTAIINSSLLLVWAFLPQPLNMALIPIVLLIIFRSVKYAKQ